MSKLRIRKTQLARARQGAQRPNRFPSSSRNLRRITILGLALCVVLIVLLSRQAKRESQERVFGNLDVELQQLVLGLASPYRDPEGRFSIVPPAKWRRVPASENDAYHALFESVNGPDLGIIVKPVSDDSFEQLLRRVTQFEREVGIETELEMTRFHGVQATRRLSLLHGVKVMALDFAADGYAHHIQFSADPGVFDHYLPAIMDVIDTYQPGA